MEPFLLGYAHLAMGYSFYSNVGLQKKKISLPLQHCPIRLSYLLNKLLIPLMKTLLWRIRYHF